MLKVCLGTDQGLQHSKTTKATQMSVGVCVSAVRVCVCVRQTLSLLLTG